MSRIRNRAALLTAAMAVAAVCALTPTDGVAAVQSLKPANASGSIASYELRGFAARRIVKAELRRGGRAVRALDVARVRRSVAAGRLRVRVLPHRLVRTQLRRAARRALRRSAARRGSRPDRSGVRRRVRAARSAVLRRAERASRRTGLVVTVADPAAPVPTDRPPATTACSPGPNSTFGVSAWPSGCWRPYAASSPFNRRIGGSPRVMANSDAIVGRVFGGGGPASMVAGDADSQWDYSHPIYWSKPGDPVFTVDCVENWGVCDVEGLKVRIPDAARAAGGSDGHLTVIDQESGWEYDFWQVRSKPAGGGTLSVSWGGRTRIDGDGLGSNATAGHFGLAAGVIRAQELAAGRIDHALFMVIKCGSGGKVYPAGGVGARCSETSDAPPMGARFQLAMSDAQIEALAVPRWKKTILRAMAEYGMYFGDTGGSGVGLQFESGSTYTSFGFEDAMVAFARQAGVPRTGEGKYVFNVRDGVDWQRYIRVLEPCSAQGTC